MPRRFEFAFILFVRVEATLSQYAEIAQHVTLGAHVDNATPGSSTLADYDFLVGKWTFRHQQRNPATGSYGPVLTGEWVGEKTYGALFADQFLLVNRAGVRYATATYRAFN